MRWRLESLRPDLDLLEHTHAAVPVYAAVYAGDEHPAADQLHVQPPV